MEGSSFSYRLGVMIRYAILISLPIILVVIFLRLRKNKTKK